MRNVLLQKTALILAAAFGLVAGAAGMAGAEGMTRDNSANSIMRGGALSTQEFVQKANANNPDDLQAVYSAYGLEPSEYDRFQRDAKMGVAHRNGEITVDGQVVARDARSVGRESKPYASARTIDGQRYYESRSQDVFASPTIPVMVLFDEQGRYETGILTACGNPIRGTPVTQQQVCESLRSTPVNGMDNTYDFSTSARAGNGSRITRVVYDFGDKTQAVERTSPTESVRHTYEEPGTYRARVTVYVDTPGRTGIPVTSNACVSTVTVDDDAPATPVSRPTHRCESLTARRTATATTSTRTNTSTNSNADTDTTTNVNTSTNNRTTDGTDNLRYTFTARASHRDATVRSVDFDFGDGNTATDVRPTRAVGSRTSTADTTNVTTDAGTPTSRTGNGTASAADSGDIGTLQSDDGRAGSGNAIDANDSGDIGTLESDDNPGTTDVNRTETTRTDTTSTSTRSTSDGTTSTSTATRTTGRTGTTEVSQTHTYAQPGTYTARAVIHFTMTDANGNVVNETEECELRITTARSTPVTPAADVEETPRTPAILPETGLGAFVALAAAASIVGSAGYYIYARRRLA